MIVLVASILMASITIYQYREEAEDYHNDRLERKEKAVKDHIKYVLRNTTYEVKTDKLHLIFKDAIFELSAIHNLQINLFDFQGNLLISSSTDITEEEAVKKISSDIVEAIENTLEKHYIEKFEDNNIQYQSSYTVIDDTQFKPLAILNLPYIENNDLLNKESKEFLERLAL